MCRVLAYIGPEIPVENLLLEPGNSLINQTLDPERHPQLQLAGWGFGVWGEHLLKPEEPLLYRRPTAAFYDDNAERNHSESPGQHAACSCESSRLQLELRPGRRELPPLLLPRDPLDRCSERRPAELEALAAGAAAALQGQVPGADAGQHRHRVPLRASPLPARERQRRGCQRAHSKRCCGSSSRR